MTKIYLCAAQKPKEASTKPKVDVNKSTAPKMDESKNIYLSAISKSKVCEASWGSIKLPAASKCKMDKSSCKNPDRNTMGHAVSAALTKAKVEKRLICGLLSAISYLEKASDDVVVCFIPEAKPGDSGNHIQSVLLQAFCYENYIPVIQVDSSEKLALYCGLQRDRDNPEECQCALITVTKDSMDVPSPDAELELQFTPLEKILVDFYEGTLKEHPRPIIRLPI